MSVCVGGRGAGMGGEDLNVSPHTKCKLKLKFNSSITEQRVKMCVGGGQLASTLSRPLNKVAPLEIRNGQGRHEKV